MQPQKELPNMWNAISETIKAFMVVVVGIPHDGNSSFLRGAAAAPSRIRQVLHAGSTNLCSESGLDLGSQTRFRDLGDLDLPESTPEAFDVISTTASELLRQSAYIVSLGGDHAVTYPLVRAYSPVYSGLTVVQLDAHPDLYDHYEGNRYSHACPFARIMEQHLVSRLIQVGIRAATPQQQQQARRFAVETLPMQQWQGQFPFEIEGPLYLSVDLDVLDPAYAPGVSHHEPGGLSTREVIRIVQQMPGNLVGADIVEFNPTRDTAGITAMAAAKLLKEIASRMLLSQVYSDPCR
jgi:arginase